MFGIECWGLSSENTMDRMEKLSIVRSIVRIWYNGYTGYASMDKVEWIFR